MAAQKTSLPFSVKTCYGFAALGEGMVLTTLAFYLMIFYTDVVGVRPEWVGIALLAGRVWDAVTDPLMGQFSDRTVSRWGRRRPYILFGSLPLAVSFLLLWMVPAGLSEWGKATYLCCASVFFYTMHTIVIMPYSAMGAEMTMDYHERTSLMTFRHFFASLAWIPVAFLFVFTGWFASELTGYRVMGAAWAVVLLLGFLVTFSGTRENPEFQTRGALPIGRAFLETFRNKSFIFLAISFFLVIWAFAFGGGFLAYVVTYVIKSRTMMPYYLLSMTLSTIAFLPFYKWLSRKIGKKNAMTFDLILYGACMASGFVLLRSDMPALGLIFFILSGAAMSGWGVLSLSILADVIDVDELATGKRREGAYFGIQNLLMKMANSVAATAVGFVLAWIGYVRNVPQTAETQLGIKIAYTLFPAAVFLITAVFFHLFFPLTREKSAEVRRQLDRIS